MSVAGAEFSDPAGVTVFKRVNRGRLYFRSDHCAILPAGGDKMSDDKFTVQQTKKLDEANNFAKRIEEYNKQKSGEDTDRTIFALTYLSTENLIQHSKTLTRLTIVLAITAIAMIALAIRDWLW